MPTATDTPVVTETPVVTDTPVVTETPVITETPSPTDEPTATETPLATPTAGLGQVIRHCERIYEDITSHNHRQEGYSALDNHPYCRVVILHHHGINVDNFYRLINP